jgi:hypothetical protein
LDAIGAHASRQEEIPMHIWIVLAAFAFAAVTPYLSAPNRSDVAQITDEMNAPDDAAEDADEDDERSA